MTDDARPAVEKPDSEFDPNGPPQPRVTPPAAESSWAKLPLAACCVAAGGVVMGLIGA